MINIKFEIVELTTPEGEVIKVLFDGCRIKQEDVPAGLYKYSARHDDECCGIPCQICKHVMINHWGDILTDRPLDLGEHGIYLITYSEVYDDDGNLIDTVEDPYEPEDWDWNYTGDTATIEEFFNI